MQNKKLPYFLSEGDVVRVRIADPLWRVGKSLHINMLRMHDTDRLLNAGKSVEHVCVNDIQH